MILDDGGGVARGRQVEQSGALAVLRVEFDEFVDELFQLVGLFGAAVAQRLGHHDQKVNDDDQSAVKVGHVKVDLLAHRATGRIIRVARVSRRWSSGVRCS